MKVRWIIGLSIIATLAATRALAAGGVQPVKDRDGNTLALVITCDSCRSAGGSAKSCQTGAQEGWLDGNPCGKCLLTENVKVPLGYPYDLHLTGKLVDDAGAPRKDRFVKMYLPNGWTVRSRTTADGVFRLMLGATLERKSKQPLVVDLGTRADAMKGPEDYSIYLLPESYKPCPPEAAPAGAKKPQHSGPSKSKSKKR